MMKSVKYVHPLTETELSELQQIIRNHKKPRVRVRAIMIRLSNEGQSATQIAQALGCVRQSVLYQIARYEQAGCAGLEDKPRSGAPAKADAAYIKALKEAVASDPRQLGYRFSAWSVERLQKHLYQQTQVQLTMSYLHELMLKHDIVYRKPKHSLAHKQDEQIVEEKKRLLEFLKKTQ
jgi:transposase